MSWWSSVFVGNSGHAREKAKIEAAAAVPADPKMVAEIDAIDRMVVEELRLSLPLPLYADLQAALRDPGHADEDARGRVGMRELTLRREAAEDADHAEDHRAVGHDVRAAGLGRAAVGADRDEEAETEEQATDHQVRALAAAALGVDERLGERVVDRVGREHVVCVALLHAIRDVIEAHGVKSLAAQPGRRILARL
jgi:hypothetical protein